MKYLSCGSQVSSTTIFLLFATFLSQSLSKAILISQMYTYRPKRKNKHVNDNVRCTCWMGEHLIFHPIFVRFKIDDIWVTIHFASIPIGSTNIYFNNRQKRRKKNQQRPLYTFSLDLGSFYFAQDATSSEIMWTLVYPLKIIVAKKQVMHVA